MEEEPSPDGSVLRRLTRRDGDACGKRSLHLSAFCLFSAFHQNVALVGLNYQLVSLGSQEHRTPAPRRVNPPNRPSRKPTVPSEGLRSRHRSNAAPCIHIYICIYQHISTYINIVMSCGPPDGCNQTFSNARSTIRRPRAPSKDIPAADSSDG